MKKPQEINSEYLEVQPRFHSMVESTAQQWQLIAEKDKLFSQQLPDWIISQLRLLRNDCHGFAIDRLDHCLQSATRAYRDGLDEEYVVCVLVHDLGSLFAPENHGEVVSLIMAPYISEKNKWILKHHTIFQRYYFAEFFGGDRNGRNQFKGHPFYEDTITFCHKYDQSSFDPDYESMTLEDFEPMIRRVLIKPNHVRHTKPLEP